MKKTLLTLISGAAIGAGTVVTLPDGETAQTVAPTSADIYDAEKVSSLKLVQTEKGAAARYIIERTSSISGVAPYQEAGEKQNQQSVFDAVSEKAKQACDSLYGCVWSSMDSARSANGVLTASVKNSEIVTITDDVPQLDELKKKILADN
ncbi:MAG TPA: hypothetical protein DCW74_01045 [Alteromonas australica]|uniref:Uncharacterized protein n=1 Tax=Alteromonas australica TaxID=589873 RepID=A0A350NZ38_9ALTE|nr:hypothetical protein [Alteromonas australica]